MSEMQRERDLVLNPNEYAYVLDKTKGLISCITGPYKMSLSNSDALVEFNEVTKRFEETGFSSAIHTFITAPENWYIVLKNPAIDNKHPVHGTANSLPELQIGKKVNIKGNISFALYPGQMAKSIQGHRLHSNQYLLARVYDAEALKEIDKENEYTIGQLLVIKGTEVQFYIPPTGIEVLPIGGKGNQYVRDAVTLERLEYCILKDEQGNKKYIHGAAVVFPEPDETFFKNQDGGYKFNAIELSDISGIYVKVIADYEENGKKYKTGEELFITGKDQMIYYPRPEHSIISYDGKVVHHAIAIPVGEGRYILDRKTGDIKTIKGAAMYLPDPRNEVVVKRKLSAKQCELWYPGNLEVKKYNDVVVDDDIHSVTTDDAFAFQSFSKGVVSGATVSKSITGLDNGFYGQDNAVVEKAGFSRGNKYTKPRTITIDNKYDGVVTVDVWTGYAINVVSKTGGRKVITGPQTCLLDYDETLEELELSTGKPKTTDNLIRTVYLRTDNNKISDIVDVQTKDFVNARIKVSYCVDFLKEYKEKWFSVENYVKYLCDRMRSLLKSEVKNYTIEKFYGEASDIVRKVVLNLENTDSKGRLFEENGMFVHDVEILNVKVDDIVQRLIDKHQIEMIEKTLELSNLNKKIEVSEQLKAANKKEIELQYDTEKHKLNLSNELSMQRLQKEEELNRAKEEAEKSSKEAEMELQILMDSIQKAKLEREKAENDAKIAHQKELDALEIAKQKAYTDAIRRVVESISPDLIAAMNSSSNAELLKAVAESMSPYAMANGESVADVTNKLLRGTSLEKVIENLIPEKVA